MASCILYAAATALRLARFNIQVTDKTYFQGLPCPPAAGLVASIIWMGAGFQMEGSLFAVPISALIIVIAALMVSTIRYYSFKHIDFKGRVPFITVVVAVFVIAAVSLEPPVTLFSLFLIYLISGPVITLLQI